MITVFIPNVGVVARNGTFDARSVDDVHAWKTARGANTKRAELQASPSARMPGQADNYRAALLLPVGEAWARHCALQAVRNELHNRCTRLKAAVEAGALALRMAPFTLEQNGEDVVVTVEAATNGLAAAKHAMTEALKEPAVAAFFNVAVGTVIE